MKYPWTTEEIRPLLTLSDVRGWQAVLTTWGIIFSSMALVAVRPVWWTVLIALILIGGRHLAIAILMHDASHRSLFRSARLNQWVGQWLAAYPTWNDLDRYREHHLRHHLYTGTDKDPDLGLVAPFPVTQKSLARKFARDLLGITGVKRLYAILLMDLGFITYTISTGAKYIDQTGRTWQDVFRTGFRNMHGVVITNLIFFGTLWTLGHPSLYLLWIGSYLTTFSLFIRIRSIAEHAVTPSQTDPFLNTRTTYANILERLTVAPHRVNYHLEHHLLMAMPYFSLPKFNKLLLQKMDKNELCTAENYREVLALAVDKPI